MKNFIFLIFLLFLFFIPRPRRCVQWALHLWNQVKRNRLWLLQAELQLGRPAVLAGVDSNTQHAQKYFWIMQSSQVHFDRIVSYFKLKCVISAPLIGIAEIMTVSQISLIYLLDGR